ncbi:protein-tyrosine-phosphatase [Aurantibacter aestuarii]|uniref:protein-tyrosine-phosphatase n=2 Tax=Aurantibacter aestuarii TaxID=1266046 RepID=A0A2T1N843_9FLAO|nr:protein-tyrosine-phosphatase [Aurantibacter aestuarii]
MVCLGNICRSPLAEGILKSKLPQDQFFIDSAGTSNYHIGASPDNRSVNIARHNDIDICLQKARQFTKQDFKDFDIIYAMDNSNYRDITALATTEDEKNKVKLILNETSPGENKDVPDPYHDTQKGFETVFNMLNEACEVIAKRLA